MLLPTKVVSTLAGKNPMLSAACAAMHPRLTSYAMALGVAMCVSSSLQGHWWQQSVNYLPAGHTGAVSLTSAAAYGHTAHMVCCVRHGAHCPFGGAF